MGIFGSARSSAGKLGCFGKLPTYGDFMSLNADSAEAQALVNWLQSGVGSIPPHAPPAATNQVLHFLWRPDGARRTLVGAMWPSTDAAGRRFPFALFAGMPANTIERYGPRAVIAAEGTWRGMHDVYALTLAAGRLNDQYGVLGDAAVAALPDVRDVNRAYVDRVQQATFRNEDAMPVGLHLSDLVHFAESLGGSARPPDFAVRMRLHGGGDPDAEAVTWLHVLSDRLGAKVFEPAMFIRLSRSEGAMVFAFHRTLQPSDLGFLLAPTDQYRVADHLGFRGVGGTASDAASLEAFNRAWAVRPHCCGTLLEVGAHGWTPGDVATGPVDVPTYGGLQPAPTTPPPSAQQPVTPPPATVPPPAMPAPAVRPRADADVITGDIQMVLQPHHRLEDATGPVEYAQDFPSLTPEPTVTLTMPPVRPSAPAPVTGPQRKRESATTAETDGAPPDPAIEIAERIRRFARGALLPGRVVRVPVNGAPPNTPELTFYVEDGAKAASLAGLQGPTVEEIARQSDDHAEARRLLRELAKIHDEIESGLDRAISDACARTMKPT